MPIIEKYNDMDALQKESNRPFEIREKDKASIAEYNKRQDKKTAQRIARKKWEKALMDDPTTPKTFAGFQSRQRALDKKNES